MEVLFFYTINSNLTAVPIVYHILEIVAQAFDGKTQVVASINHVLCCQGDVDGLP